MELAQEQEAEVVGDEAAAEASAEHSLETTDRRGMVMGNDEAKEEEGKAMRQGRTDMLHQRMRQRLHKHPR